MLNVKVNKTVESATLPLRATEGAAAYDLATVHGGNITPGEAKVFDTGLQMEIPSGYCMLVFSRSGHGFNKGLRLANSVGVIDSDYRGNIMVKLHNDSKGTYQIEAGDRIAQAMIIKSEEVEFLPAKLEGSTGNEVASTGLTKTARGKKGFGSTGAS
ncbi:MAG: dUTP diphosphatase [Candidatus Riesia sp.]|nr:dUTP diphosphatase [Candidatus Riesia sp.]